MRPRILILPVAAIIITAMVVYKQTRTYDQRPIGSVVRLQSAPLFEEFDENNQPVRLKTYIGRHIILLAFFNGELGADRDPQLLKLRAAHSQLAKQNIVVLAVGTSLPQENRSAINRGEPFPFPLLSDVDYDTHRRWGRFDEATDRPFTGVFHIDRAGRVSSTKNVPQPVVDLDRLLAEFADKP
jgi:peroxiredoxin